MKFKIGLLVIILIGFAATPYFIQNGGSLPNLADDFGDILSTEQTRQKFHKWQDASGKWHFGESAPEGVATTVVNVDTAANVIRSVKLAKAEKKQDKRKKDSKLLPTPAPMTVSPDKVSKMMDDARNVENLLSERTKQIDAVR